VARLGIRVHGRLEGFALSRKPRIIAAFAVLALVRVDPWLRVTSDIPVPDSSRLARFRDEPGVPAPPIDVTPTVPLQAPPAIVTTDSVQIPEPPSDVRQRKAVLSLIRYPYHKLGYEIVFVGPRPGYRAMTLSNKHRIEVYVRPGDRPELLAYDLAHELGHAFDLEYNNSERRTRWRQLRGIEASMPWFGCNRCPDYDTPAGDFAETFAYLLLGPGNYHSRMAEPPDDAEVRALAAFCRMEHPGSWFEASNRSQRPTTVAASGGGSR